MFFKMCRFLNMYVYETFVKFVCLCKFFFICIYIYETFVKSVCMYRYMKRFFKLYVYLIHQSSAAENNINFVV